MGRKCCVTGCTGNYSTGNKETVFRLPHPKKHKEQREQWIKAIPRDNIPDSSYTCICEKHWPKNYETEIVHGRKRPIHPPSIFHCVKPSQIPTPQAPLRSTVKAHSSTRNVIPDQLDTFL